MNIERQVGTRWPVKVGDRWAGNEEDLRRMRTPKDGQPKPGPKEESPITTKR